VLITKNPVLMSFALGITSQTPLNPSLLTIDFQIIFFKMNSPGFCQEEKNLISRKQLLRFTGKPFRVDALFTFTPGFLKAIDVQKNNFTTANSFRLLSRVANYCVCLRTTVP
jgi:hypothetical protein